MRQCVSHFSVFSSIKGGIRVFLDLLVVSFIIFLRVPVERAWLPMLYILILPVCKPAQSEAKTRPLDASSTNKGAK